jgi:hypothetical protein
MTDKEKARVVTKLIADQLKPTGNFAMRDVEDCVVTLLRERTDGSSRDPITSVWNEALEAAARKADKVIQVGLAAEIRDLER